MTKPVQDILKHLSRSRTAFRKGESLRSMVSVAEALKMMLTARLHSVDMQKIGSLLREDLQNISKLEEVKKRRKEPLSYRKGNEKQLLVQLVPLIKAIHAERRKESMEAVRDRKLGIDRAIIHGRNALAGGKVEEARKYFRQATDLYVDEDAMFLIIADALFGAGAYKESFEYLRQTLMLNPGDRKACDMVVEASKKIGNVTRGLTLLKKVREKKEKTPHLLLAMARLTAHQKQFMEAVRLGKGALAMDPKLVDARKFLRKIQSKAAADSR